MKKQLGQHTRAGTSSQGGISLTITACNDVVDLVALSKLPANCYSASSSHHCCSYSCHL
jgi:hypothetical protein